MGQHSLLTQNSHLTYVTKRKAQGSKDQKAAHTNSFTLHFSGMIRVMKKSNCAVLNANVYSAGEKNWNGAEHLRTLKRLACDVIDCILLCFY